MAQFAYRGGGSGELVATLVLHPLVAVVPGVTALHEPMRVAPGLIALGLAGLIRYRIQRPGQGGREPAAVLRRPRSARSPGGAGGSSRITCRCDPRRSQALPAPRSHSRRG